MITFVRNGLKEVFVSAKLTKQKVGSGCVLFYLIDICWCFLLYGARPRDYVMFEFYYQNHRRRNQCFTTFRFFSLMKKLDKLTACYKIHNSKENQLRLFAPFIKRNWMRVDSTIKREEIMSFVRENGKVIVKPNGGTYGKGVFMIEGENDNKIQDLLNGGVDLCWRKSLRMRRRLPVLTEVPSTHSEFTLSRTVIRNATFWRSCCG